MHISADFPLQHDVWKVAGLYTFPLLDYHASQENPPLVDDDDQWLNNFESLILVSIANCAFKEGINEDNSSPFQYLVCLQHI